MALHEQCVGATDEWYTPPYIFEAMASRFALDVASPGQKTTPWIPASKFITEDSLSAKWNGFAWMNPPFGGRNGLAPWLDKFIQHGNGVCLVPDRTSAPWWQAAVIHMESILFVAPKIKFINAEGIAGRSPAQGTCLMSIGGKGTRALRAASGKIGVFFLLKNGRDS